MMIIKDVPETVTMGLIALKSEPCEDKARGLQRVGRRGQDTIAKYLILRRFVQNDTVSA